MIHLSNRLRAAADMVRSGAKLADIGCDHGYVPVCLIEEGKIPCAVAADIHEGPLASCIALVSEHHLEDKVKCVLSDGLEHISEEDADDILIAGMGGELMAEILSKCSYVQKKHLILNPMTHPEIARKWLYDNGFRIDRDIIAAEGRHYYSVFDAVYTGEFPARSRSDEYLGNIQDFSERPYFLHLLHYLRSKEKGGEDYADVITAIEERINDDNSKEHL